MNHSLAARVACVASIQTTVSKSVNCDRMASSRYRQIGPDRNGKRRIEKSMREIGIMYP